MKFYRLRQTYKQKLNKHAFSLLELTIVLAIIIIVATISIPLFFNFKEQHLIAEASTLRATLWHLQQMARAQNTQKLLTFDELKNSYSTDNEKHKLSRHVKFGTLKNVLGPPSSPNKQLKKAITFKDKKITVTPHGILQPGTIYLIDDTEKFLYAITVPVAGVSYIRIYRYHNKQWHAYT